MKKVTKNKFLFRNKQIVYSLNKTTPLLLRKDILRRMEVWYKSRTEPTALGKRLKILAGKNHHVSLGTEWKEQQCKNNPTNKKVLQNSFVVNILQ